MRQWWWMMAKSHMLVNKDQRNNRKLKVSFLNLLFRKILSTFQAILMWYSRRWLFYLSTKTMKSQRKKGMYWNCRRFLRKSINWRLMGVRNNFSHLRVKIALSKLKILLMNTKILLSTSMPILSSRKYWGQDKNSFLASRKIILRFWWQKTDQWQKLWQ